MARAIATALAMPEEEQARRITALRDRLRRYDVVRWADDFLEALGEDRSRLDRRMLFPATRKRIVREFRSAGRRLLLLDYDGTLISIKPTPSRPHRSRAAGDARPAGRAGRRGHRQWPSPRDARRLAGATRPGAGGRARAWARERGGDWAVTGAFFDNWKPGVRDLMERYVDRLPGQIEEKEFAWPGTIAWPSRPGALRRRSSATT